ncbi:NAD(P)-dependent oxidoreductase [Candidatus Williamhamiltonella defendens]|uniref:NAD(P)-dependent oxidoreductase n=1 Tax=Candidatus Williamhamiltonella defendens TaxID=138072 RepID=UPI00387E67E1
MLQKHAITENLISDKDLSQIKRGSLLINTSRGKVVNINSLYNALKNQHLAGAVIDVFPEETSS